MAADLITFYSGSMKRQRRIKDLMPTVTSMWIGGVAFSMPPFPVLWESRAPRYRGDGGPSEGGAVAVYRNLNVYIEAR